MLSGGAGLNSPGEFIEPSGWKARAIYQRREPTMIPDESILNEVIPGEDDAVRKFRIVLVEDFTYYIFDKDERTAPKGSVVWIGENDMALRTLTTNVGLASWMLKQGIMVVVPWELLKLEVGEVAWSDAVEADYDLHDLPELFKLKEVCDGEIVRERLTDD